MHPQDAYTRDGIAGDRTSRSMAGIRRPRSDDSWIEVSSAASSSSASLHGTNLCRDSISSPSQPPRRRRRLLRNAVSGPIPTTSTPESPTGRPTSAATSSQEEYEESESESDRIITSSNENIHELSNKARDSKGNIDEERSPTPASSSSDAQSQNADNDDENATALGIGTNTERVFTPPANAFTHPPSYASSRQQSQPSVRQSRSLSSRTAHTTPSTQTQRISPTRRHQSSTYPRRGTHSPYSAIAPSHRIDHDAALRASLSTLLSCAAAVRGQSKPEPHTQTTSNRPTLPLRPNQSNAIQPSTLRLMPHPPASHTSASPPSHMHLFPGGRQSQPSVSRSKRKASPSRSRRPKKSRAASPVSRDENVLAMNPTLLGWMMSAGVVVLFSALSFSAGYVMGKEAGRLETLGHGVQERVTSRDMGEAGVRGGLRRLRAVGMASA